MEGRRDQSREYHFRISAHNEPKLLSIDACPSRIPGYLELSLCCASHEWKGLGNSDLVSALAGMLIRGRRPAAHRMRQADGIPVCSPKLVLDRSASATCDMQLRRQCMVSQALSQMLGCQPAGTRFLLVKVRLQAIPLTVSCPSHVISSVACRSPHRANPSTPDNSGKDNPTTSRRAINQWQATLRPLLLLWLPTPASCSLPLPSLTFIIYTYLTLQSYHHIYISLLLLYYLYFFHWRAPPPSPHPV